MPGFQTTTSSSAVFFTKPQPPTRLVTSRNTRAVCSTVSQAGVKTPVDSVGEQRSDSEQEDLVDVYNDGLRQVLYCHSPFVTRRVRDRSSASRKSEEVRAALRQRRRADRRWRMTHLTVHTQIVVVNERVAVKSCVQALRNSSTVTESTPYVQAGSSSRCLINC